MSKHTFKHTAKHLLRNGYAAVIWHTGLWRLFDRLTRRRLVILAGHCVGPGAGLPADMTLSTERLRTIIGALSKRMEWQTVGDGTRTILLDSEGPSLAALSFDDGYRDNFEVLLPILKDTGAKATVFLEGRPLVERKVSWSHKLFWLIHRAGLSPSSIAEELLQGKTEGLATDKLRTAAAQTDRTEYHVKRALKYDCTAAERDKALERVFRMHGGNDAELCEALYMTASQAKELERGGVELGGHTYDHEVLSSLDLKGASDQVVRGAEALTECLGDRPRTSFAYPFGRRWDFRSDDAQAVESAGYAMAVTTHPGVFTGEGDRYRLGRIMVEESTPIHHIMAEASGAYEFLRRFGLELAE